MSQVAPKTISIQHGTVTFPATINQIEEMAVIAEKGLIAEADSTAGGTRTSEQRNAKI
jgi:hypothetical protein